MLLASNVANFELGDASRPQPNLKYMLDFKFPSSLADSKTVRSPRLVLRLRSRSTNWVLPTPNRVDSDYLSRPRE